MIARRSRRLLGLGVMLALTVAPTCLLAACSGAPTGGEESPQSNGLAIDDGVVVRVVSVNSGLALDVWGLSRDDGAEIQQWGYWAGTNQRWSLHHVGGLKRYKK